MGEFVGTRGEGEPTSGSDGRPYDEYSGAPFESRKGFLDAKKKTQISTARDILSDAGEKIKPTSDQPSKPKPFDPGYKTVGGLRSQMQDDANSPTG